MHCARCGRPASAGDGALCRYCGGPLVADDPMMAYGAANPHLSPVKKARGGGILRIVGSGAAILLTIVIIAVVRVGLGAAFGQLFHAGATSSSPSSYSEALTSNPGGWPNDANAYFQPDGYHIVKSVIAYAPDLPAVNVDVSVRVVQISGDDTALHGIVFRRWSTGNYYAFEIDSQGEWEFGKVVNGQWTPIVDATVNSAIQPGLNVSNTLEVQATGTHYVFLVNGTQVGEADDATTSGTGKVGLDGDDGAEVVYSHFAMNWHSSP
jgi:hypothetical protein